MRICDRDGGALAELPHERLKPVVAKSWPSSKSLRRHHSIDTKGDPAVVFCFGAVNPWMPSGTDPAGAPNAGYLNVDERGVRDQSCELVTTGTVGDRRDVNEAGAVAAIPQGARSAIIRSGLGGLPNRRRGASRATPGRGGSR